MSKIEIGGTPADEPCAQIGPDQPPGGESLNRLECQAYIAALRAVYGKEPEGCELRIQSNAHDFGSYREVIVTYDGTNPENVAYALKVEDGLSRWDDAGFWPPVTYDDAGRAIYVIKDPTLWPRATNPQCLKERPVSAD